MDKIDSQRRATEYCEKAGVSPEFGSLLGTGQEGFVWQTDENSAIKVYDRKSNFDREIACYSLLQFHGVNEIDGFAIPELLGDDEDLRVIELSIVSPPYLLDFGKAYVHQRPEFDQATLDQDEEIRSELFGENWGMVQSAIWSLESYGIFYMDARPGNIDCTDHPDAV